MKYEILLDGKIQAVNIVKQNESITVERNGKKTTFTCQKTTSGWLLSQNGKTFHTNLQAKVGEKISVNVNDKTVFLDWKNPYEIRSGISTLENQGDVKAVMPGRVVKLLVSKGQNVKAGQPLLVLEAMKMENEIKSPKNGKISAIHVQEAQSVESGARLVSIE